MRLDDLSSRPFQITFSQISGFHTTVIPMNSSQFGGSRPANFQTLAPVFWDYVCQLHNIYSQRQVNEVLVYSRLKTCIVRNYVLLFAYCRVHVVFGRVIEGEQFVVEIENQKVDTNHRPYADVRISNSGELVLVKGTCVGAWSVLFPSPYSLCLQNGNSTKGKRIFKNRPYDLLMQYLCLYLFEVCIWEASIPNTACFFGLCM